MDEKLKTLIKPVVEQLGFILYDVVYEQEGEDWFLRVVIDSDEREITIDDCVEVTETLNPILDEEDPIKNEYMFEVSSAGAEKQLRSVEEYKKSIDKYVYIKVKEVVENLDEVYGTLLEVNDNSSSVKVNFKRRMKNLSISFSNIEFIRLAVKF
jgi:ribosome maturation factor RimP